MSGLADAGERGQILGLRWRRCQRRWIPWRKAGRIGLTAPLAWFDFDRLRNKPRLTPLPWENVVAKSGCVFP